IPNAGTAKEQYNPPTELTQALELDKIIELVYGHRPNCGNTDLNITRPVRREAKIANSHITQQLSIFVF
ncbi:MAG TPA: hypothetical protein VE199_03925, partial [Nitrososphaera sp.]|nr:hypothetical protein [Nitrososphaera sp.]